jgi:hypothetical protein
VADDEEPTLEEALENLREATPRHLRATEKEPDARGRHARPAPPGPLRSGKQGALAITEAAFVEARRGWLGFE